MDDLVELTRMRETEVGPEPTTHRTYQGQNRWQTEIWIKSRELGSGSYGAVWLEEESQSRRVRAVKRVRKQRTAWDERKEIAAMAKVRQFPQYFAYLHGWYESQDWIYLAMDYFEMGDLSHHLQGKLPENQARGITQQLLRGLVELHGMGITHRDLKLTNIFVVAKSASSWDVRIGDFGIAKRVNADETELRTITGTRQYMAPELDPWLVDDEEAHSYTQAVDVWALGILLFQILTLQVAFQDPSSLRKYFKGKTAFPKEPLLHESTSSPCIEFLMAVLQPKPMDRPTSKDTFDYEWMKASTSDSGISPVQHSLSEVHLAQDYLAVGNSFDAQQHQSAERRTLSYQHQDAASDDHLYYIPNSQRAQYMPGFPKTIRQHSREEFDPRSPSQKSKPAAHDIAANDNPSPDSLFPLIKASSRPAVDGAAYRSPLQKYKPAAHDNATKDNPSPDSLFPLIKASSRPAVDGAAYRPLQKYKPAAHHNTTKDNSSPAGLFPSIKVPSMPAIDAAVLPPPDSKRERAIYSSGLLAPKYISSPAKVSSSNGDATEALLQRRGKSYTPEGHPYHVKSVDHNTRQTSQIDPRVSPSGIRNSMLPHEVGALTAPLYRPREPLLSVPNVQLTVIAADELDKQDMFSFPDPFAVVTVDGGQKMTTGAIKKTLNPHWDETFTLRVIKESVIAVQIFDSRKSKKKDQGFLGIVTVLVGSNVDLDVPGGNKMITRDLKKSNDSFIVTNGKLQLHLQVRRPAVRSGILGASQLI